MIRILDKMLLVVMGVLNQHVDILSILPLYRHVKLFPNAIRNEVHEKMRANKFLAFGTISHAINIRVNKKENEMAINKNIIPMGKAKQTSKKLRNMRRNVRLFSKFIFEKIV